MMTSATNTTPMMIMPTITVDDEVEAFLDFEVNQTYIQPEYMNNPVELAKIRAMIDELHVDHDITINRLDLIGYASPEGSVEVNARIAAARAEAVKTILVNKYKISASRITAEGQGVGDMFTEPDWNRVSICTIED